MADPQLEEAERLRQELARSEATWPLIRSALLALPSDTPIRRAVELIDRMREAGKEISLAHKARRKETNE